jgi:hypothetical protein
MANSQKTAAKPAPKTSKRAAAAAKSAAKRDGAAGAASSAAASSAAALLEEDYASWDPSKAVLLLATLLGHWPTLSAEERAELDALSTDAQRAALGARTRARGTAGDALRWAVSIDRQLTEYAVLREHYDPARFAYYLLRLLALYKEIGKQEGRSGTKDGAKTSAESAQAAADAALVKLDAAMDRFAGNVEDRLKELKTARAVGDDGAPGVVKRLLVLAAAWRKKGTPFMLRTSRLSAELLAEVRAAFDALAHAGAEADAAGPGIGRDSPPVNVAEGAVLEEMKRVHDDVEAAWKECAAIERLAYGKATRAVLGNRKKPAGEPAAADDGAQPADGGGK